MLVAVCVALALVTGALAAGARYFYCPAMDQLARACCCSHGPDETSPASPTVDRAGCCETVSLPAAPAAEQGGTIPVVAPALVAVLPAAPVTAAGDAAASCVAHPTRAGPAPPAPLRNTTCVFLL
jgi:hypothetical protein